MDYQKLIASAEAYRLGLDLKSIAKGIEDNKQQEAGEKDNIFKKFGRNVGNSVRKSRTEDFEKAQKADEDRLAKVKENGILEGDEFLAEAKKLDSQAKKTAFGLLYLLSDDYKYEDEDTKKALSTALFGSDIALTTLYEEFDKEFKSVSSSLFASAKPSEPIKLALLGYLNAVEAGAVEGCGFCTANKGLADVSGKDEDKEAAKAILAFLFLGKNNIPYCMDEEKGKAAFLGINKDNLFAAAALKATLFLEEKKDMKADEVEAYLRSVILGLSSLRAQAEIELIVEKKDEENAKAKISTINAFISRLGELNK